MQPLIGLFATLLVVKICIAITSSSPSYDWFDPLIDVRGVLIERHLETPDESAMQKAAILAMIESLNDPYAVFVPDDKEEAFIKDLEGDYAGIGAEVRMVDGNLTIITPMENSPALKAGIKAGDIVESIDNVPAQDNATIQSLIERLTGPPGTEVVIDVRRINGDKKKIVVVREHIQSQSVVGLFRKKQQWMWGLDNSAGIAYIRIRQFNDNTPQELLAALQSASNAFEINGLILDLRENPGGSLSSAITIANMFLKNGTIVTVSGRTQAERSWEAQPDTMLSDAPMIVLVNNSSASASEIVSGSLQANDRAAILGTRTFGKGSVQEVMELASGGMLKFTTARYDLANGRTIDKRLSADTGIWGVDPNIGLVVAETTEEAIARIKSREPYTIITNDEPAAFPIGDTNWIKETYGDLQLSLALQAMREQIDKGDWPLLTQEDPVLTGIQEEVASLAKSRIEILKSLVDIDSRLTRLQTKLDEENASLIPSGINLKETNLTLKDSEGNIIGSWTVTNGDIESALDSLQLSPIKQQ